MSNPDIMDGKTIKTALADTARHVEAWLAKTMEDCAAPERLLAAMRYSLMAGGKRIRPVLCLLSATACGEKNALQSVMPFAAAIECIHTYSLIHDDLPAMDDDDLRRGKPSCHKQFDEATAILAGDGLLTDAFMYMTRCAEKGLAPERVLRAIALAAEAAGSPGMVGGQSLDMEFTGRSGIILEELAAMHAMKTGAMIRMACEAGAVLAGAGDSTVRAFADYGRAFGAAFQITDDILDVTGTQEELGKPVGSDEAQEKNTYPSLLGLEQSRALARERSREAALALAAVEGPEADLLRGLAEYMVNRVS